GAPPSPPAAAIKQQPRAPRKSSPSPAAIQTGPGNMPGWNAQGQSPPRTVLERGRQFSGAAPARSVWPWVIVGISALVVAGAVWGMIALVNHLDKKSEVADKEADTREEARNDSDKKTAVKDSKSSGTEHRVEKRKEEDKAEQERKEREKKELEKKEQLKKEL